MYLGVPVEAFSPAGRALRHCANAPAASFVTHCVRSSVQWPFAASATAPSARWLHALTRLQKKEGWNCDTNVNLSEFSRKMHIKR